MLIICYRKSGKRNGSLSCSSFLGLEKHFFKLSPVIRKKYKSSLQGGGKMLSPTRRAEVEHQALLSEIRKRFSLKDLRNLEDRLGDLVDEPAFVALRVTEDELRDVLMTCMLEVLDGELKFIKNDIRSRP
jgi:hypothetical protein